MKTNDFYYIAAFRSRAQTIRYYEILHNAAITASVMNTPPQAALGCGISVKVMPEHFHKAQKLLICADYTTFLGWFCVRVENGRICEVIAH